MRTTLLLVSLLFSLQCLDLQGAPTLNEGRTSQLKKAKKKKKVKKKYAKKPYWKEMMTDPEVNYFEAKEAFDAYWGNNKEQHGEGSESKSKKDLKAEAERQSLSTEQKVFRKWLMDSAPYVQPDGTVLSEEEQRRIIENAR